MKARPRILLTGLLVPVVYAGLPATAEAIPPLPSCDCDHVIELDQNSARGDELGVAPGALVCVRGGVRPFLRLYDFEGSEEAPIVITNCEGQVEIDNEDRGYGLTGEGMRHVVVTGTGDAGVTYGFKIRASRRGPDYSASGVVFSGLSTNYELDHMEVYDAGFAGFNLKTEPRCDGSANLGNFVQYDTHLHHIYIHDTRGEGLYLGSTGYGGREYDCDGTPTLLYPHEHHGVEVHDLRIEDTGWDGAQIGVTPLNCRFHHNLIRNVGLEDEQNQRNALQIGGGSSCEIFANRIENGPTNGIIILDAGDTFVHDNVVVGFGTHGLYVNDRGDAAAEGRSYHLVHNTIVDAVESGLTLFSTEGVGHVVKNNIVVDIGGTPIAVGNGVDWSDEANLVGSGAEVGFVDLAGRNFDLRPDAAAVDAGVDLAPIVASEDIRGVPRDALPDIGAYEWTDDPPDDDGGGSGDGDGDGGGGDGDGGPGDTGDDGTGGGAGSEDDGGCACDSGRTPRSGLGPLSLLLAAAVLGARGRRRRSPAG